MGGECEKPWFLNNFKGKILWKDGAQQSFKVAKGKAPPESDHQVDGMSGATITGNGITHFVNQDMSYYENYFSKIRGS